MTGWPANIVEYFQLLCTTQFMNHIRPQNLSFADIRRADWGNTPETPFDQARTADVRSISAGLANSSSPISVSISATRRANKNRPPSRSMPLRHKFDPAGHMPLFTAPPGTPVTNRRVTPLDVPMPISRQMLYANFGSYYGKNLSLWIDASTSVRTCNLSDVTDASGNVIGWAHAPHHSIAIDPQLGRIAFPSAAPAPSNVHVNYSYGFSAQMGGGPYSRPLDNTADVLLNVPMDYATIQAAIDQAHVEFSGGATSVIIEIGNSEYYRETPSIKLPKASLIQAADAARASAERPLQNPRRSEFQCGAQWPDDSRRRRHRTGSQRRQSPHRFDDFHCTLAPLPVPVEARPLTSKLWNWVLLGR